jgi:hypothetical protein
VSDTEVLETEVLEVEESEVPLPVVLALVEVVLDVRSRAEPGNEEGDTGGGARHGPGSEPGAGRASRRWPFGGQMTAN